VPQKEPKEKVRLKNLNLITCYIIFIYPCTFRLFVCLFLNLFVHSIIHLSARSLARSCSLIFLLHQLVPLTLRSCAFLSLACAPCRVVSHLGCCQLCCILLCYCTTNAVLLALLLWLVGYDVLG